MTEIEIDCPHCSQHIQCDEGYRGMEINCPTCKQLFLIPIDDNPAAASIIRPQQPRTAHAAQAPRFVAEPQDVRITEGGTARFLARAEAIPSPTYQWFSVDRTDNGQPLAGETNPELKLANPTLGKTRYAVRVANSAGDAMSRVATLSVEARPFGSAHQKSESKTNTQRNRLEAQEAEHLFKKRQRRNKTLAQCVILVVITIGFLWWRDHHRQNNPGSVAYLDFKNGIGGISFGESLPSFKELGFAPDGPGPTYGEQIDYTNEAFRIEFGDYYLTNTALEFIADKLVYIHGDVKFNNQNGDLWYNENKKSLDKFLKVLFGEPTTGGHTGTHFLYYSAPEYLPGPFGGYEPGGNVFSRALPYDSWIGKKIKLTLYDGDILVMTDYQPIAAKEQEEKLKNEKEEKEREKEETERMRKQGF
jgi:phage FluMu protein Com